MIPNSQIIHIPLLKPHTTRMILYHHLHQFLYDPLPFPLYQLPNPDRKRPNSKKPLFYPVTGLIRPYNKIYTLQFYILRISSRAPKCC